MSSNLASCKRRVTGNVREDTVFGGDVFAKKRTPPVTVVHPPKKRQKQSIKRNRKQDFEEFNDCKQGYVSDQNEDIVIIPSPFPLNSQTLLMSPPPPPPPEPQDVWLQVLECKNWNDCAKLLWRKEPKFMLLHASTAYKNWILYKHPDNYKYIPE